jgi:hypothetical protein
VRFFEALFAEVDPASPDFGVEAIVAALHRRPELVAINSAVDEEYWQRSAALTEREQLRYRTAEGVKAIQAP